MAKRTNRITSNVADLLAREEEIDRAICGFSLLDERKTRFAQQGAHDAAPTFYFILDALLGTCELDDSSHLLDVGCSTGRVLAHFVNAGLPGRATGIELDPQLAATAQSWTARYNNLAIICGNALDIDLTPYTHFYLFNPFSPGVLQQFIESIEYQVPHTCTVIHMSDNGDTWHYVGRDGWTELASGAFDHFVNERGYKIKVYDYPQHYTIWQHQGSSS